MQPLVLIIYSLFILIMSVVAHEVSHGYVAYLFGDVTAKYQGRLTLNPIKHFDPVGSFLVPMLGLVFGGVAFGWAKPVPINPYNFRNERLGSFAVSIAGVGANILIALVFGIIIRILIAGNIGDTLLITMLAQIVLLNISLAIFNLVPFPPFDGFKVFSAIVNVSNRTVAMLDQYGIIFILIVVFFLWTFISPLITWVFTLFTGLT